MIELSTADTRIGSMRSRARPLLLIAACFTSAAVSQTLPAQWSAPVDRLPSTVQAPYALVSRPMLGERFIGVDVIALEPRTMRPISRSPTTLRCDRIHASATGQLICFSNVSQGGSVQFTSPTSYWFSRDLEPLGHHANQGNGQPSRARISTDGKFSATTEITTGHSYVSAGTNTFSTSTIITERDSKDGRSEDIQNWPVFNGGARVKAVDLNLWGVTFHPVETHRFYVTAFFDGKPYLAEGDVQTHRISVVRAGVECPSFSPDGLRLAFKKRTSSTTWSPAVLDLATMKETDFDVGNSVDDQIEWLDGHTLIYEVARHPLIGVPTSDLMTLDLLESKPAQHMWLAEARSATFVRR